MHSYLHPDGSKLPSVTTILDATASKAERIQWVKRREKFDAQNGEGAWDKKCDAAKLRGTAIHALAEAWLTGNPLPPIPDDLAGYWQSMQAFLSALPPHKLIASEQAVLHPELRYGGRPDVLLEFESGKRTLLDFKTYGGYTNWCGEQVCRWELWRKPKKGETKAQDWDWVHSYPKKAFLQGCLYKLALDYNKIPVHEIWIVVLSDGQGYQSLPLLPAHWAECKTEALDKVQQYHSEILLKQTA